MKKTALGKALAAALTTAFPKVTLAEDSELAKLILPARAKSFDKAAREQAATLVLAMDSEIEKDKVILVMDALADVDDPKVNKKDNEDPEPAKDKRRAKDSKRAKDESEEEEEEEANDEEEEKKRKEAADKAAKDAECAAKSAMDSFKAELREADEARRDVRPIVGDVIAQDSASEIYGFALDQMKVDHKGVEGVPALRALFRLAKDRQSNSAPVHVAMDSAGAEKQFPGLARFLNA